MGAYLHCWGFLLGGRVFYRRVKSSPAVRKESGLYRVCKRCGTPLHYGIFSRCSQTFKFQKSRVKVYVEPRRTWDNNYRINQVIDFGMVIRDVDEIRPASKTTQAHIVPIKQELMSPRSILIQYFQCQYQYREIELTFCMNVWKLRRIGRRMAFHAGPPNSIHTRLSTRNAAVRKYLMFILAAAQIARCVFNTRHCGDIGRAFRSWWLPCFVLTFMSDSLIKTRKQCFQSHPLFHADPQSVCSYADKSTLCRHVESFKAGQWIGLHSLDLKKVWWSLSSTEPLKWRSSLFFIFLDHELIK